MSRFPNEDAQTPQVRRLQEWWLQLPLSYRVNALLYAFGAVALVFLLVTLLSDDGQDRRVQAGPAVTATSVATTRAAPTTAAPPPSSSSSSSSSTAPSSSTSSSSPSTTRASTTSSGQTNTTRPADTTSVTTTTTSTTAPAVCRNSTNPACGPFVWDPQPAANQPLATTAEPLQPSYKVGEKVFFRVTASDPDHLVNANCSEVRFDNGYAADGPCSPPPSCPDRYGPWAPPAAEPGSHTATYEIAWSTPGEHTATFRFRSWSSTQCLPLDPYASEGQVVTARVTITE